MHKKRKFASSFQPAHLRLTSAISFSSSEHSLVTWWLSLRSSSPYSSSPPKRSINTSSSSERSQQFSAACRSPTPEAHEDVDSEGNSRRSACRADLHSPSTAAARAANPAPWLLSAAVTLPSTSCSESACTGALRRRSESRIFTCTSNCRTPATWNQAFEASSSPTRRSSTKSDSNPSAAAASCRSSSNLRASAVSFRACSVHSSRC
mmetsp:Transcript_83502/g.239889  ORF Transcript_83502/g.239889 Transcript_83502/m.239889 type:complete len:207 (+) Transcript_83502:1051-1671(+)